MGVEQKIPDHPAKYSRKVIDRLREMLQVEAQRVGHLKVIDAFAGVGGVHELAEERIETYGMELQPEWSAAHPDTITGSVLELPAIFPAGTFDCLCTSPAFGNRMADSHQAKDPCRRCGGDRCEPGYAGDAANDGGPDPCSGCGGTGLTKRNTYAHYLRAGGAEPVKSPDNSALMAWGPAYRSFHLAAWSACDRVLRRDGLALLNVKNHHRGKRLIRVVEFHLNAFLAMGYSLEGAKRVETRGLAHGANHESRTGFELILALRAPA